MNTAQAISIGILIGIALIALFKIVSFLLQLLIEYLIDLWNNRGGGYKTRVRNKHRNKLGLPKIKINGH